MKVLGARLLTLALSVPLLAASRDLRLLEAARNGSAEILMVRIRSLERPVVADDDAVTTEDARTIIPASINIQPSRDPLGKCRLQPLRNGVHRPPFRPSGWRLRP